MTDDSAPRWRARAVVVRDGRVLLVRRLKHGRWYAVVPGGGVEGAETTAQAASRELREETSLTAVPERVLWVDDERRHVYFVMGPATGEVALGGPELARQTADDQHVPTWVELDELDAVDLRPERVRAHVRALGGEA